MATHWKYGLYIDDQTDGKNGKLLGLGEGRAFANATIRALVKLESKPIGLDLLHLIGKRCEGVGTKLVNGRITIHYGTGTLVPLEVSAADTILGSTYASSTGHGARTNTPIKVVTDGGVVELGMKLAGQGSASKVCYNPFISIGEVFVPQLKAKLKMFMGVETPAFVALGHELIHAFHSLSGDRKTGNTPGGAKAEEAWTVGAGKYANTRISENAIRKEHGLPLREYYSKRGDCD
jgi:hypothetical protein